MSCCYFSYLCLLLDFASNYFEVDFFHCKSCAFIRSKPHFCQTHWLQMFFVGWLIMLGRGDSFVARAVLSLGPTRAIAKHTGFRCFFVGWLMMLGRGDSFVARAVLSLGRSRAIAKHTRFRSFMWVGSTGWEEVILSLQELCFH